MKRNYDDPFYKAARSESLKRDGRKCQMPGCGKKRSLQSHHIIPWSKSQALRLDVDNLITLCRACHESIKDREHHYVGLFSRIVRDNKK